MTYKEFCDLFSDDEDYVNGGYIRIWTLAKVLNKSKETIRRNIEKHSDEVIRVKVQIAPNVYEWHLDPVSLYQFLKKKDWI